MTSWAPERWATIKALFHDLTELPFQERDAALAARTVDDPEAREALRRMLQQWAPGTSLLDGGAAALLPSLAPTPVTDSMPVIGSRVGDFEVLREVGRGGMGVVYEATRREGSGLARVAIKVLPPTRADALFAQRFASEQRLLGQLDHPGIARLVDAGWTPAGRPWYAMAYVEGTSLDAWCASHQATPAQRASLVRETCTAVQHAHDRNVLHRDIKPSNILVTPDGDPILVDFGIARALDDDTPGTLTRRGIRPMSLMYASPEHLAGRPLTPASDVYSLGVVLYSLLAGQPPNSSRLAPSLVVSAAAARRGAAPANVAPFDACTMVAISHDPGARYPTPREFGAALTRALDS